MIPARRGPILVRFHDLLSAFLVQYDCFRELFTILFGYKLRLKSARD